MALLDLYLGTSHKELEETEVSGIHLTACTDAQIIATKDMEEHEGFFNVTFVKMDYVLFCKNKLDINFLNFQH